MSLLSTLLQEPLIFVTTLGVFIIALSFHESAHAFAGYLMGDMTARRMGRLTLNPLAHIDPIGLLALLTIGFGWAKPVPYNPYNLRYPRLGPFLVAFAGPGANLLLGMVAALLFGVFLPRLGSDNLLVFVLARLSYLNFGLMLFNLLPVPPLDGSQVLHLALSGERYRVIRERLETHGPMVLMGLMLAAILFSIPLFGWIGEGATTLLLFFSGLMT